MYVITFRLVLCTIVASKIQTNEYGVRPPVEFAPNSIVAGVLLLAYCLRLSLL